MGIFRMPEHEEGYQTHQIHISHSQSKVEINAFNRRGGHPHISRQSVEKNQDFSREKEKGKAYDKKNYTESHA
jgi:hypothetical protein